MMTVCVIRHAWPAGKLGCLLPDLAGNTIVGKLCGSDAPVTASAGNSRHLQTLLLVCGKLLHFLGSCSASRPEVDPLPDGVRQSQLAAGKAAVYTVNDFLFAAGLDDINMFRLTRCVGGACNLRVRIRVYGRMWPKLTRSANVAAAIESHTLLTMMKAAASSSSLLDGRLRHPSKHGAARQVAGQRSCRTS